MEERRHDWWSDVEGTWGEMSKVRSGLNSRSPYSQTVEEKVQRLTLKRFQSKRLILFLVKKF